MGPLALDSPEDSFNYEKGTETKVDRNDKRGRIIREQESSPFRAFHLQP
jgi:hypothetical protein